MRNGKVEHRGPLTSPWGIPLDPQDFTQDFQGIRIELYISTPLQQICHKHLYNILLPVLYIIITVYWKVH